MLCGFHKNHTEVSLKNHVRLFVTSRFTSGLESHDSDVRRSADRDLGHRKCDNNPSLPLAFSFCFPPQVEDSSFSLNPVSSLAVSLGIRKRTAWIIGGVAGAASVSCFWLPCCLCALSIWITSFCFSSDCMFTLYLSNS